MLAFKNDVGFWKNNKSMKGLSGEGMGPSIQGGPPSAGMAPPGARTLPRASACSCWTPGARAVSSHTRAGCAPLRPGPLPPARSVLINAFCQLVIFLYLLDSETSMVVLFSSGVGMLIEFWKVRRRARPHAAAKPPCLAAVAGCLWEAGPSRRWDGMARQLSAATPPPSGWPACAARRLLPDWPRGARVPGAAGDQGHEGERQEDALRPTLAVL